VNVDELELADARHQDRVDRAGLVEPLHQLVHQRNHVLWRRGGVNNLAGLVVRDEILDGAISPGRGGFTADADDQPAVDFTDDDFA